MNNYNNIGKSYNSTRKPDSRIVSAISQLLNTESRGKLIDIGAGTGNYSFEFAEVGYEILAIEPSEIMIDQSKTHPRLQFSQGFAEQLPAESNSYDGAISTLASHHFSDLTQSLKEIWRVLKTDKTFVLFTYDPRLIDTTSWFYHYFPELLAKASNVPPQREMIDLCKSIFREVTVQDFLLPENLEDQFFMSGWKNPHWYLDKAFRDGISPFALADQTYVEKRIAKLNEDLESGFWNTQFYDTLNQNFYHGGYYFISCTK